MFIPELKTFHDAMKPLIYFNWASGVGTFRLPNQRTSTYILMRLYTVCVNVASWTMIYITLNALSEVISSDHTPPMALNMLKVLVCANSSITVIAPLLLWFQEKGLVDWMRRVAILDNTCQTVLGTTNEYRKWYIRLICHAAACWSVMVLVTSSNRVFEQRIKQQLNMQSMLMYFCVTQALHQPIAVMLLLDLNFCTLIGYLGKKFRDLNDSLVGLSEKPLTSYPGERLFTISQNAVIMKPGNDIANVKVGSLMNDKHYLLREIRKAHLELCKLSQKINYIYGVQNLISAGVSFVMITGLLYTIYSILTWKNFNKSQLDGVISAAIWTSIYVFKIWMVNHSCWTVSNEADRTGEVIYGLLNSRVDKELLKVIQEFGVQMLQNPVRFNACGFFTLDYTFVQGVIGSITTYLVILIQMSSSTSHLSPAAKNKTSETAFAWNVTEISVN